MQLTSIHKNKGYDVIWRANNFQLSIKNSLKQSKSDSWHSMSCCYQERQSWRLRGFHGLKLTTREGRREVEWGQAKHETGSTCTKRDYVRWHSYIFCIKFAHSKKKKTLKPRSHSFSSGITWYASMYILSLDSVSAIVFVMLILFSSDITGERRSCSKRFEMQYVVKCVINSLANNGGSE